MPQTSVSLPPGLLEQLRAQPGQWLSSKIRRVLRIGLAALRAVEEIADDRSGDTRLGERVRAETRAEVSS